MNRPVRGRRSAYRKRLSKRDCTWPHNRPMSRPLPREDSSPVVEHRFKGQNRLKMLRRRIRGTPRPYRASARSRPWLQRIRSMFPNYRRFPSWGMGFHAAPRRKRDSNELEAISRT